MQAGIYPDPDLTESAFNEIGKLVKDSCGINLHAGKKELVRARLGKRLRDLGLTSYRDYLNYLRQDSSGDEFVSMLNAISTNVTNFFREPHHFAFLEKKILPHWLSRQNVNGRRLRIWSAGCASGEEPYSIAIVINELLPEVTSWDIKILATDLSTAVLAAAKHGYYDPDRLKDVPPYILGKYFKPEKRSGAWRYQVNDKIRSMVSFARLNFMEPWPMHGPFDIIFCRNVMIYFEHATRQQLVKRFWEILSPGGWLLIGHSETFSGIEHEFAYVEPTVYQKQKVAGKERRL